MTVPCTDMIVPLWLMVVLLAAGHSATGSRGGGAAKGCHGPGGYCCGAPAGFHVSPGSHSYLDSYLEGAFK